MFGVWLGGVAGLLRIILYTEEVGVDEMFGRSVVWCLLSWLRCLFLQQKQVGAGGDQILPVALR